MSSVKSIKCTNCAAPLDLLGGGRVETVTCSYCKSTLDLNDNYKVLSHFKKTINRNNFPFKIGMQGELKGIEYTIIGLVTYRSIGYPISEWTDFLLFSPLYGYAYLTYEDGHLIYSKRNRTFPNTPWDKIPKYDAITVDGKIYIPFDKYDATIEYVEGELTWVAKRDDKSSFIDLVNAPYGISVEKSKNEIEHYDSEYLEPSSIYEAFGAEKQEKSTSFHILKPFKRPFLSSLSQISFWVLFVIALFALVAGIDGFGKPIQSLTADNKGVKHLDFNIQDTKYLVDLKLTASSSKALNNFKVEIHKNNKIYLSLTSQGAYLFEHTTGKLIKKLHPWEKESKKVRVSLNIEEKGSYHLSVKPINKNLNSKVFIQIHEASSRLNYFVYFFFLTLFSWLLYKFFHWRYINKVNNERGIIGNAYTIGKDLFISPVGLFIIAVISVIIIDINFLLPLIIGGVILLSFLRPSN